MLLQFSNTLIYKNVIFSRNTLSRCTSSPKIELQQIWNICVNTNKGSFCKTLVINLWMFFSRYSNVINAICEVILENRILLQTSFLESNELLKKWRWLYFFVFLLLEKFQSKSKINFLFITCNCFLIVLNPKFLHELANVGICSY